MRHCLRFIQQAAWNWMCSWTEPLSLHSSTLPSPLQLFVLEKQRGPAGSHEQMHKALFGLSLFDNALLEVIKAPLLYGNNLPYRGCLFFFFLLLWNKPCTAHGWKRVNITVVWSKSRVQHVAVYKVKMLYSLKHNTIQVLLLALQIITWSFTFHTPSACWLHFCLKKCHSEIHQSVRSLITFKVT